MGHLKTIYWNKKSALMGDGKWYTVGTWYAEIYEDYVDVNNNYSNVRVKFFVKREGSAKSQTRNLNNKNTYAQIKINGSEVSFKKPAYFDISSNVSAGYTTYLGEASATVYPNFNSNTVWLSGKIVPYENSDVFEGMSL